MWKRLAIWMSVLTCAWPLSASAELMAPITMDCRNGEYVVGLMGNTGAWIDSIAPVCAKWDERTFQSVMITTPRVHAGGRGGARNQQTCPDGTALMSWQVDKVVVNEATYASAVVSQCGSLLPAHALTGTQVRYAGGGGPAAHPQPRESCSPGQLATGVHGWVSHDQRFVTEVKLTCGRAPFVQSAMSQVRNADGSVNYSSPSFVFPDGESIRVDACHDWAANCGAPAADTFCQSQKMGNAVSFDTQSNVPMTIVLSSRRICRGQGCTALAHVTCHPRS
ncbi:hypothetical protein [Paraburkholderia sp. C35]|uniref:hypothetical protein n=1 Tax=Paraburkholderia sp. C35 TaxID=2126993 RepID=UPI000D697A0B|nr:hypothetical protein [Paraburkholderia sp. C35]